MKKDIRNPLADIDFFEDLTGEIPDEPRKGTDDIGQRIRAIREEQGLPLDELAKMTGFEVEFLANDLLDDRSVGESHLAARSESQ